MQRKKILHIVEAFGGGIFSFLVDLVNNTEKDMDIIIAYGIRNETPEDFKKYFSNRIQFVEIKNFTRSINLKKDIKSLKEIRNVIEKEQPDIIHLHSSKAGILGRLATNCRKRKVLYNPHGFSFLMQDSSKLKRIIYWLIEKIFTLKNCTIIGCSKGEYEEALKLTKNSIWINNGIDINKLKEETMGLRKKEIDFNNLKICTVGRAGYQKNPKLFNEIASNFPDLRFTWIGDGELKSELTSKNIEVTGWKKRKEVLKILNENDIFILTSLWEGLPISLLEAMYMQKTCIVSDCIGNRDVIQNGENGFICKKSIEFKNIIKSIKNSDNNKFATLTIKANNDIIQNYNMTVMTNDYLKFYMGE